MFTRIKEDIRAALERDPAARGKLEILMAYSGLHAVWAHRLQHWLWQRGFKLLARWLAQASRFFTGVEIHPGALIGRRLFIDHGMGVVIGETAEIGDDVTIYHGVTLGGTSLNKGKRHPTIEQGVVIGAGAKVLGAIVVGRCSRIGANAVVVKDVPPDSVVVGVPGRVVEREHMQPGHPDLDHGRMPDTVSEALGALSRRVARLEKQLAESQTLEEKTGTIER